MHALIKVGGQQVRGHACAHQGWRAAGERLWMRSGETLPGKGAGSCTGNLAQVQISKHALVGRGVSKVPG
jgi:hypothetical protein